MPISQADISSFNFRMDQMLSNPDFFMIPDNDKGLYLNQTLSNFMKEFRIDNSDDRKQLEELSETKFQQYRDDNYIPRFIPKEKDIQEYYEPLYFSETDSNDDKITKIDAWRDASLKKASSLRPANSQDFSHHLHSIANEQIRMVQGENTGWLGDKVRRCFF